MIPVIPGTTVIAWTFPVMYLVKLRFTGGAKVVPQSTNPWVDCEYSECYVYNEYAYTLVISPSSDQPLLYTITCFCLLISCYRYRAYRDILCIYCMHVSVSITELVEYFHLQACMRLDELLRSALSACIYLLLNIYLQ